MQKEKLLIVDDEKDNRDLVTMLLTDYEIDTASNGREAITKLRQYNYNLILLDIRMPEMDGITALKEIKKISPQTIVVILSAFTNDSDYFNKCKFLADDIIDKDIDHDLLVYKIDKIFKNYSAFLAGDDKLFVTGSNSKMLAIQQEIETKIADSNANILISGESGTGKEYIAKLIHEHSSRRKMPFIAVNCSSIDKGCVTSELFGHVKGAFTDAKEERKGLFEQADGGTLFLDEITETELSLQAKLLRSVQEKKITRLGSTKEIELNIRIITATNRNIEESVKNGTFREDLYYRLNVININLPPLRNRKEDLLYFANFFIKKFNAKNNRCIETISKEALQKMLDYDFPGNLRELANIVERAVILAKTNIIGINDIRLENGNKNDKNGNSDEFKKILGMDWQTAKSEFGSSYFKNLLDKTGGNVSKAAEIAVVNRNVVYENIKK